MSSVTDAVLYGTLILHWRFFTFFFFICMFCCVVIVVCYILYDIKHYEGPGAMYSICDGYGALFVFCWYHVSMKITFASISPLCVDIHSLDSKGRCWSIVKQLWTVFQVVLLYILLCGEWICVIPYTTLKWAHIDCVWIDIFHHERNEIQIVLS